MQSMRMQRCFRPTRRTRLRIVLLAVLAMLFQQVALASYVCARPDVQPANMGMSAHCDGMPMTQGQQNPALCPAHCADQAWATQNVSAPTVPPLTMPAVLTAPIVVTTLPVTHAVRERTSAWRRTGIPPALRFRVLLI